MLSPLTLSIPKAVLSESNPHVTVEGWFIVLVSRRNMPFWTRCEVALDRLPARRLQRSGRVDFRIKSSRNEVYPRTTLVEIEAVHDVRDIARSVDVAIDTCYRVLHALIQC